MNYLYDPKEMDRVMEARESYSGRLLTDMQFDEGMAITGILEREIRKSGKFKEKLGDYAYALSRSEKFDVMKAETVIRDLFKIRCGQSMNEMREAYRAQEENLTEEQKRQAYQHAAEVGAMIREGDKMTFHRAYAHQASVMADELNITHAGAKALMKEKFQIKEGKDLYEWGKELEEEYYRPQVEAEKKEREAQKEVQKKDPQQQTRTR